MITFLLARGFNVHDEVRLRIMSCHDLEQLDTWIQKAASIESIDELF